MAKKKLPTEKVGSIKLAKNTGQARDSKGRFMTLEDTAVLIEKTRGGKSNVAKERESLSAFTDYKKELGVTPTGLSRYKGQLRSREETESLLAIAKELSTKGAINPENVRSEFEKRKVSGGELLTTRNDFINPYSVPDFIDIQPQGTYFEIIDIFGDIKRTRSKGEAKNIMFNALDLLTETVQEMEEEAKEQGDEFYVGTFFQLPVTTLKGTGGMKVSFDLSAVLMVYK